MPKDPVIQEELDGAELSVPGAPRTEDEKILESYKKLAKQATAVPESMQEKLDEASLMDSIYNNANLMMSARSGVKGDSSDMAGDERAKINNYLKDIQTQYDRDLAERKTAAYESQVKAQNLASRAKSRKSGKSEGATKAVDSGAGKVYIAMYPQLKEQIEEMVAAGAKSSDIERVVKRYESNYGDPTSSEAKRQGALVESSDSALKEIEEFANNPSITDLPVFEDAVNRHTVSTGVLLSGANIPEHERENFKAMAPTKTDMLMDRARVAAGMEPKFVKEKIRRQKEFLDKWKKKEEDPFKKKSEEKKEKPKSPPPGSIVTVKGKKYRLEEDGDTLTPLGE